MKKIKKSEKIHRSILPAFGGRLISRWSLLTPLLLIAVSLALSSCTRETKKFSDEKRRELTEASELIMTCQYSDYKKVHGLERFDAIEMGGKKESPKIEYLVTFKVIDIIKGEFWSTGKGVYYEKRKPSEKLFIKVGAMSPMVFGIVSTTAPAESKYTIYMKYYPEGSGYYRVIGSEWELKERYKKLREAKKNR